MGQPVHTSIWLLWGGGDNPAIMTDRLQDKWWFRGGPSCHSSLPYHEIPFCTAKSGTLARTLGWKPDWLSVLIFPWEGLGTQVGSVTKSRLFLHYWNYSVWLWIFELNGQSNYTTVLLRRHADWLEECMGSVRTVALLPIYRARTVCDHELFSAHTQNGQLENREEQFA